MTRFSQKDWRGLDGSEKNMCLVNFGTKFSVIIVIDIGKFLFVVMEWSALEY